ncbi:putative LTR retrotransposon [Pseudoloma neurophilia]|uniref:Putative LTR retrotransposon n=1 Tax=Pseudoloma neurophilia TaxID=146866 RepID=A0A0R0LUV9_9MICR|nr:putative LTR retrotransposon [Pseudoloma neurophilia]
MKKFSKELSIVEMFLRTGQIPRTQDNIHNKNLHQVLKILKENGITINLSKSKFLKTEVEYLGTIIDANGIRPITTKLAKYDNFQEPQKVKDLQSLLGFINWFRPFVPKLSQKLHSINALLQGKRANGRTRINWNGEHTHAIKNIFNEI